MAAHHKTRQSAITADSNEGRVLLALRAGGMTSTELIERFGSAGAAWRLAQRGLVDPPKGENNVFRLNDAGRAACPLRNPLAAIAAPAPAGAAGSRALPHSQRQPIPPFRPTRQPDHNPQEPATTMNTAHPTATELIRQQLAAAPEGITRQGLLKSTGLGDSLDGLLCGLIKAGLAERRSRGVIAPTPRLLAVAGRAEAAPEETSTAAAAAKPEPLEAAIPGEEVEIVRVTDAAQPAPAPAPAAKPDFAIYDDGRLTIADGDEILILQPKDTRRLAQFLCLFDPEVLIAA